MLKKGLYQTWNKELLSLPEQVKAFCSRWETEEGRILIRTVFEESFEIADINLFGSGKDLPCGGAAVSHSQYARK